MTSSGVGELLRRERVSKQLTLDDISQATKISPKFLKAIEAEDFESLPGLIFTRNFVAQYATFLKIDPQPLLALIPRVDLESAPMPQPPDWPCRGSWNPRWNSALASLAWAFLAGGAAVAAYVHFNRPTTHMVGTVQAAPRQTPRVSPPHSDSVPAVASSAADVKADIPTEHPVQVLVVAREESWVQAVADGKSVFAGILKAGETRAITADEQVSLRTGNAGGIDISLNGKPLDALGPSGQIRSITLTAGGPQLPSVPAPQNPPSEPSRF